MSNEVRGRFNVIKADDFDPVYFSQESAMGDCAPDGNKNMENIQRPESPHFYGITTILLLFTS